MFVQQVWQPAEELHGLMAKHAVLGLVGFSSQQPWVHGIRVNSVSTSAIAKPLTSNCMLRTSEKDVENVYGLPTSLKGVVLTVDFAEAVLLHSSPVLICPWRRID